MEIKLIAIDVDDTLLNSQGHILSSTKKSIKKALNAGIKVVLCTGRPLAGVKHFLNELGIDGDQQYVITFNGAVIQSVAGNIIIQHSLENTVYEEMDAFSKKHKIAYNVLDQDSHIYTSNHQVNRFTVIQAWENFAGISIQPPNQLLANKKIIKGIFVGERAELDLVEPLVHQKFKKQCYVVRSAPNFLEVMPQNVNKGEGLKQLTEILEIIPESVVAFGDEQNDLPMFEFAGTSVAMGNGTEVVKQRANIVTDDNNHDGIANVLNQILH